MTMHDYKNKIKFYEISDETNTQIGQTREPIVLGDLNARTGRRTTNNRTITSKHDK